MPDFVTTMLKNVLRYSTLCCGLSILTACTIVGPDYEEPAVEWLQDWQPSAYGDLNGANEQSRINQTEIQFWWHLFNDPVLNALIIEARQENHSLRIAGLKIFESRARLAIADSSLYPQLQQLNGNVSSVNNQFHGGNAPDSSQSFISYQSGFNLGWELDFWGRFQRGIEAADAAFFASVTNQQDVQVLLTAQLADAYFYYRTTQARIDIALKNAEIQKRSYEITSHLFEEGEGSELDLQQAKTQYLATLSTIPELEIVLYQTRNAIAILLGKKPGALAMLEAAAKYQWPVISVTHFQYIPANMLIRRPDIRSAAWQVAVQSAQIGVAEADYYPAISLFGTIGWSASDLAGSSDVGSLIIGPAFSWNILDYDRIENNVRIQDSRLQQLIEQYQNLALQAAKEVNDASYSLLKTNEQKLLVNKSFQASQRALELANIRYREGYSDFQRVLDAQRAMFSQAERQLLNQGSYISSIISLYKSMGGGWSEMSNDQLLSTRVKETMQQRTDWGDLLTAPLSETMTIPEASQHE